MNRLGLGLGLGVCLALAGLVWSGKMLVERDIGLGGEQAQSQVGEFEDPIEEELFWRAIGVDYELQDSVRMGIVPHDPLAGMIIAQVVESMASDALETIILIGPDHEELGQGKTLTTNDNLRTPFGVVEADKVMVSSFLEKGLVRVDQEAFDDEHSVNTPLMYVRYFMPDIKVVSLMVSGYMRMEEIEELVEFIEPWLKDEAVKVIASVDFSHYLPVEEADKNDIYTYGLMEANDYGSIIQLNSDYVDSPAALITVLMLARNRGYQMQRYAYSNSGRILSQPLLSSTTSYMGVGFEE